MSRVTKAQKAHRRERQAREERRLRAFAGSRRRRPAVLKRPPKWARHLARRRPEFAYLVWRQP